MSDSVGCWPEWIENAVEWANEKIVRPVIDFVAPAASISLVATIVRSLPLRGNPNSSQTLHNPDGTPKQKRWYGPDGNAIRDRDYNHTGDNLPFPHDHEWEDGERQTEHLPPSPDYQFSSETFMGVGLVAACTIGMVVIAADDLTGVGVADNALLIPLGTGVSSGLSMIFGG